MLSNLHMPQVAAVAGLIALLLVACGGSPITSATGGAEPTGAGGQTPTQATGADDASQASDCEDGGVEEVLAEVEGLEGEERTVRLVDLAEQAGGTVHLYTSLTNDLVDQVQTAFPEEYGLDLEVYRASGESVTLRLLQEVAAGSRGADFVESGGQALVIYAREGILAPYESPEREALIDEAVVDDAWTGSRMQVFAPAWNTELVDDPPESWEDLADPRWDGRMAMEATNAEWYMALTEYWVEQGKSEEEVEQLWSDIAEGAFIVSGHSTMLELMIAGEFGAVATLFSYMTDQGIDSGASVEWRPPVLPLIIRPQGAGIVECSRNPAGAVLLMDWWLSADGAQQIFVDSNIDSVREDLWDLGEVETYAIDVVQYFDEAERWDDEFERLTGLGEAAG